MKKIEAYIRESKLQSVRDALSRMGVEGLTVLFAHGGGSQKGPCSYYRGSQYDGQLLPRIKLEVVVQDNDADVVIDAIYESAYTGAIGDGRILVSSLDEVIRIRTGVSEGATAQAAER